MLIVGAGPVVVGVVGVVLTVGALVVVVDGGGGAVIGGGGVGGGGVGLGGLGLDGRLPKHAIEILETAKRCNVTPNSRSTPFELPMAGSSEAD